MLAADKARKKKRKQTTSSCGPDSYLLLDKHIFNERLNRLRKASCQTAFTATINKAKAGKTNVYNNNSGKVCSNKNKVSDKTGSLELPARDGGHKTGSLELPARDGGHKTGSLELRTRDGGHKTGSLELRTRDDGHKTGSLELRTRDDGHKTVFVNNESTRLRGNLQSSLHRRQLLSTLTLADRERRNAERGYRMSSNGVLVATRPADGCEKADKVLPRGSDPLCSRVRDEMCFDGMRVDSKASTSYDDIEEDEKESEKEEEEKHRLHIPSVDDVNTFCDENQSRRKRATGNYPGGECVSESEQYHPVSAKTTQDDLVSTVRKYVCPPFMEMECYQHCLNSSTDQVSGAYIYKYENMRETHTQHKYENMRETHTQHKYENMRETHTQHKYENMRETHTQHKYVRDNNHKSRVGKSQQECVSDGQNEGCAVQRDQYKRNRVHWKLEDGSLEETASLEKQKYYNDIQNTTSIDQEQTEHYAGSQDNMCPQDDKQDMPVSHADIYANGETGFNETNEELRVIPVKKDFRGIDQEQKTCVDDIHNGLPMSYEIANFDKSLEPKQKDCTENILDMNVVQCRHECVEENMETVQYKYKSAEASSGVQGELKHSEHFMEEPVETEHAWHNTEIPVKQEHSEHSMDIPVKLEHSEHSMDIPVKLEHSEHSMDIPVKQEHSEHSMDIPVKQEHSEHSMDIQAQQEHSEHSMEIQAQQEHSEHSMDIPVKLEHSEHSMKIPVKLEHSEHSMKIQVQQEHSEHSMDIPVKLEHSEHSMKIPVKQEHSEHSMDIPVKLEHSEHSMDIPVKLEHSEHSMDIPVKLEHSEHNMKVSAKLENSDPIMEKQKRRKCFKYKMEVQGGLGVSQQVSEVPVEQENTFHSNICFRHDERQTRNLEETSQQNGQEDTGGRPQNERRVFGQSDGKSSSVEELQAATGEGKVKEVKTVQCLQANAHEYAKMGLEPLDSVEDQLEWETYTCKLADQDLRSLSVESRQDLHSLSVESRQDLRRLSVESRQDLHRLSVESRQDLRRLSVESRQIYIKESPAVTPAGDKKHNTLEKIQQRRDPAGDQEHNLLEKIQQRRDPVGDQEHNSLEKIQQRRDPAGDQEHNLLEKIQQRDPAGDQEHNTLEKIQQRRDPADDQERNTLEKIQQRRDPAGDQEHNTLEKIQQRRDPAGDQEHNTLEKIQQRRDPADDQERNTLEKIQQRDPAGDQEHNTLEKIQQRRDPAGDQEHNTLEKIQQRDPPGDQEHNTLEKIQQRRDPVGDQEHNLLEKIQQRRDSSEDKEYKDEGENANFTPDTDYKDFQEDYSAFKPDSTNILGTFNTRSVEDMNISYDKFQELHADVIERLARLNGDDFDLGDGLSSSSRTSHADDSNEDVDGDANSHDVEDCLLQADEEGWSSTSHADVSNDDVDGEANSHDVEDCLRQAEDGWSSISHADVGNEDVDGEANSHDMEDCLRQADEDGEYDEPGYRQSLTARTAGSASRANHRAIEHTKSQRGKTELVGSNEEQIDQPSEVDWQDHMETASQKDDRPPPFRLKYLMGADCVARDDEEDTSDNTANRDCYVPEGRLDNHSCSNTRSRVDDPICSNTQSRVDDHSCSNTQSRVDDPSCSNTQSRVDDPSCSNTQSRVDDPSCSNTQSRVDDPSCPNTQSRVDDPSCSNTQSRVDDPSCSNTQSRVDDPSCSNTQSRVGDHSRSYTKERVDVHSCCRAAGSSDIHTFYNNEKQSDNQISCIVTDMQNKADSLPEQTCTGKRNNVIDSCTVANQGLSQTDFFRNREGNNKGPKTKSLKRPAAEASTTCPSVDRSSQSLQNTVSGQNRRLVLQNNEFDLTEEYKKYIAGQFITCSFPAELAHNESGSLEDVKAQREGDTSVKSLQCEGDITVRGCLQREGDTSVRGCLQREGDTSVRGCLQREGDTSVRGCLQREGDTSVRGCLQREGDTSVRGCLQREGDTSVRGCLQREGDTSVRGCLQREGDTSVRGCLQRDNVSCHGSYESACSDFLEGTTTGGHGVNANSSKCTPLSYSCQCKADTRESMCQLNENLHVGRVWIDLKDVPLVSGPPVDLPGKSGLTRSSTRNTPAVNCQHFNSPQSCEHPSSSNTARNSPIVDDQQWDIPGSCEHPSISNTARNSPIVDDQQWDIPGSCEHPSSSTKNSSSMSCQHFDTSVSSELDSNNTPGSSELASNNTPGSSELASNHTPGSSELASNNTAVEDNTVSVYTQHIVASSSNTNLAKSKKSAARKDVSEVSRLKTSSVTEACKFSTLPCDEQEKHTFLRQLHSCAHSVDLADRVETEALPYRSPALGYRTSCVEKTHGNRSLNLSCPCTMELYTEDTDPSLSTCPRDTTLRSESCDLAETIPRRSRATCNKRAKEAANYDLSGYGNTSHSFESRQTNRCVLDDTYSEDPPIQCVRGQPVLVSALSESFREYQPTSKSTTRPYNKPGNAVSCQCDNHGQEPTSSCEVGHSDMPAVTGNYPPIWLKETNNAGVTIHSQGTTELESLYEKENAFFFSHHHPDTNEIVSDGELGDTGGSEGEESEREICSGMTGIEDYCKLSESSSCGHEDYRCPVNSGAGTDDTDIWHSIPSPLDGENLADDHTITEVKMDASARRKELLSIQEKTQRITVKNLLNLKAASKIPQKVDQAKTGALSEDNGGKDPVSCVVTGSKIIVAAKPIPNKTRYTTSTRRTCSKGRTASNVQHKRVAASGPPATHKTAKTDINVLQPGHTNSHQVPVQLEWSVRDKCSKVSSICDNLARRQSGGTGSLVPDCHRHELLRYQQERSNRKLAQKLAMSAPIRTAAQQLPTTNSKLTTATTSLRQRSGHLSQAEHADTNRNKVKHDINSAYNLSMGQRLGTDRNSNYSELQEAGTPSSTSEASDPVTSKSRCTPGGPSEHFLGANTTNKVVLTEHRPSSLPEADLCTYLSPNGETEEMSTLMKEVDNRPRISNHDGKAQQSVNENIFDRLQDNRSCSPKVQAGTRVDSNYCISNLADAGPNPQTLGRNTSCSRNSSRQLHDQQSPHDRDDLESNYRTAKETSKLKNWQTSMPVKTINSKNFGPQNHVSHERPRVIETEASGPGKNHVSHERPRVIETEASGPGKNHVSKERPRVIETEVSGPGKNQDRESCDNLKPSVEVIGHGGDCNHGSDSGSTRHSQNAVATPAVPCSPTNPPTSHRGKPQLRLASRDRCHGCLQVNARYKDGLGGSLHTYGLTMDELNQSLNADGLTMDELSQSLNVDGLTMDELNQSLNVDGPTMDDINQSLNVDRLTMDKLNQSLNVDRLTMDELNQSLNVDGLTMDELNQSLNVDGLTMDELNQSLNVEEAVNDKLEHSSKMCETAADIHSSRMLHFPKYSHNPPDNVSENLLELDSRVSDQRFLKSLFSNGELDVDTGVSGVEQQDGERGLTVVNGTRGRGRDTFKTMIKNIEKQGYQDSTTESEDDVLDNHDWNKTKPSPVPTNSFVNSRMDMFRELDPPISRYENSYKTNSLPLYQDYVLDESRTDSYSKNCMGNSPGSESARSNKPTYAELKASALTKAYPVLSKVRVLADKCSNVPIAGQSSDAIVGSVPPGNSATKLKITKKNVRPKALRKAKAPVDVTCSLRQADKDQSTDTASESVAIRTLPGDGLNDRQNENVNNSKSDHSVGKDTHATRLRQPTDSENSTYCCLDLTNSCSASRQNSSSTEAAVAVIPICRRSGQLLNGRYRKCRIPVRKHFDDSNSMSGKDNETRQEWRSVAVGKLDKNVSNVMVVLKNTKGIECEAVTARSLAKRALRDKLNDTNTTKVIDLSRNIDVCTEDEKATLAVRTNSPSTNGFLEMEKTQQKAPLAERIKKYQEKRSRNIFAGRKVKKEGDSRLTESAASKIFGEDASCDSEISLASFSTQVQDSKTFSKDAPSHCLNIKTPTERNTSSQLPVKIKLQKSFTAEVPLTEEERVMDNNNISFCGVAIQTSISTSASAFAGDMSGTRLDNKDTAQQTSSVSDLGARCGPDVEHSVTLVLGHSKPVDGVVRALRGSLSQLPVGCLERLKQAVPEHCKQVSIRQKPAVATKKSPERMKNQKKSQPMYRKRVAHVLGSGSTQAREKVTKGVLGNMPKQRCYKRMERPVATEHMELGLGRELMSQCELFSTSSSDQDHEQPLSKDPLSGYGEDKLLKSDSDTQFQKGKYSLVGEHTTPEGRRNKLKDKPYMVQTYLASELIGEQHNVCEKQPDLSMKQPALCEEGPNHDVISVEFTGKQSNYLADIPWCSHTKDCSLDKDNCQTENSLDRVASQALVHKIRRRRSGLSPSPVPPSSRQDLYFHTPQLSDLHRLQDQTVRTDKAMSKIVEQTWSMKSPHARPQTRNSKQMATLLPRVPDSLNENVEGLQQSDHIHACVQILDTDACKTHKFSPTGQDRPEDSKEPQGTAPVTWRACTKTCAFIPVAASTSPRTSKKQEKAKSLLSERLALTSAESSFRSNVKSHEDSHLEVNATTNSYHESAATWSDDFKAANRLGNGRLDNRQMGERHVNGRYMDARHVNGRQIDGRHTHIGQVDERHSHVGHVDGRHSDEGQVYGKHMDGRHGDGIYLDVRHGGGRHSEDKYINGRNLNVSQMDGRHSHVRRVGTRHSDVKHVDERHADVRHKEGRHSDVRHVDGRYSDVRHVDGRYSDLSHGDGRHSDLSNGDGRHSDLNYVDGRHSHVSNGDGRHSDLNYVDGGRQSDLSNGDGRHSHVSNGNGRHSHLRHVDGRHSDLRLVDGRHSEVEQMRENHSQVMHVGNKFTNDKDIHEEGMDGRHVHIQIDGKRSNAAFPADGQRCTLKSADREQTGIFRDNQSPQPDVDRVRHLKTSSRGKINVSRSCHSQSVRTGDKHTQTPTSSQVSPAATPDGFHKCSLLLNALSPDARLNSDPALPLERCASGGNNVPCVHSGDLNGLLQQKTFTSSLVPYKVGITQMHDSSPDSQELVTGRSMKLSVDSEATFVYDQERNKPRKGKLTLTNLHLNDFERLSPLTQFETIRYSPSPNKSSPQFRYSSNHSVIDDCRSSSGSDTNHEQRSLATSPSIRVNKLARSTIATSESTKPTLPPLSAKQSGMPHRPSYKRYY